MIAIQHRTQKLQTNPLGKIKTGEKGMSASGKEIPKALDHFNIDAFPELKAMYGDEPKELLIAVPSDNIPDVFDDRFALYGNQTKLRSCDGDTCTHRINETICGQTYGVGEESDCVCLAHDLFNAEGKDTDGKDLKKKACRYTMNLKAFVLNPKDGTVNSTMPYLFETGSRNSGSAVYSALASLSSLTGLFFGQPKLSFLPMRLWVKMVGGKEDAKMKFPIWELTPPNDISVIVERLTKVGRALGWDEALMTRIADSTKQIGEGGTPLPKDIANRISESIAKATTRQELIALGHQILELPKDEQESLQSQCRGRFISLGFDKKEVEAEREPTYDPANPLGV